MEHAGGDGQPDGLAGLADHLRRQQTAFDRAREESEQHARAAVEQAARLHATLGAMADGVWICNQAGVLISVNDAGLEMFGLQRSEVTGQLLAVLARLFRIGRDECRRLGLDLALQGETIHAECDVSLRGNTGDLTVDIRAAPIRDEGDGIIGAVAVVRNITDAKNTDRLKDEFLSVAAHELKTPITALKGYTQLAIKRTPPVPETQYTRRALETIDEQADRITRLVQKLLDVSRIQSGGLELQPVRFDLQKLMARVVEQAQVIAPSHTIILTAHAPIMVMADYARLEQVLLNLVDNAIKYSSKDGTIRLASELLPGRVRVSVHDHGVGIPENKLPHIFDRWYQAHWGTHGDYGGMGLGLYICKEIIEQHGGHMWATSSGAAGTAIGFVLPLPSDEPAEL
jgi:PAS domain S-box-containing protein